MKKYYLKLNVIIVIAIVFSSCRSSAVVVRERPEPPVVVRPLSPGPSNIWVDGEWFWRGNQYVYRPGYWAAPRRRYAKWVPGLWRPAKGGWYWVAGHWK